jgi:hypothetical protein
MVTAHLTETDLLREITEFRDYPRKRMTKGEARRAASTRHLRLVKREEIAQAVAGCDLDPSTVRQGKDRLFEERWYAQILPTAKHLAEVDSL